MNECVDGEYQAFKAKGGAYTRKEFFGRYPEWTAMVAGHDRRADRQYSSRRPRSGKGLHAYRAALEHKGGPTVMLAKTVKGYGMGEAGEARNHRLIRKKKLNEKAHRAIPHPLRDPD